MSELFVVFHVGGADYVVPSAQVAQLESYQGATRVPGTVDFVAGIVLIRGAMIPAVDLRRRFGLEALPPSLDTRVVVVTTEKRRVALIVDRAREVVRLERSAFQPPPAVVVEQSAGFVSAIAQAGDRMFLVLDFEKVIGEETLHAR